jgi:uncharacterized protein (DUF2344 family)
MGHETPIMQRLQITFGKFGALKYTGNLDVSKVWERVLRRAKLPLLYTQGFNTRPRIQLASMLPMGVHKFAMHIEQYAHHTLLNKHERDLRTN